MAAQAYGSCIVQDAMQRAAARVGVCSAAAAAALLVHPPTAAAPSPTMAVLAPLACYLGS
jgi:hypothetical protein